MNNILYSYLLGWVGKICIFLACFSTVVGFLGVGQWQLSLFDHPRPHYCLLVCVGLISIALHRTGKVFEVRNWIVAGVLCLLVNTYLLMPVVMPSLPLLSPSEIHQFQELRVAHLTLDGRNVDVEKIKKYVDSKDIDVLSVLEVYIDKVEEIDKALNGFSLVSPNRALKINTIATNAWFVSNERLSNDLHVNYSKSINVPSTSSIRMMELSLFSDFSQGNIVFLSFQARRPTSAKLFALLQREFSGLARWCKEQVEKHGEDTSIIVVGDFNSTPWSQQFRKLLRTTKLINTQRGRGLQATWHSRYPSFLRMPIDHILCSRDLRILSRESKGDVNSDHLPVFASLTLKK